MELLRIYLPTQSEEIAFLYFTGSLLKKLVHDKLPKFVGVISFQDGILAVPCWSVQKLCLFEVQYKEN